MNEKRPRALVDRARLDALLNDDLAPPPPPPPPPSSSPQLEIEPPSAALLDAMETAAEDEPDDDAIAPVETPIPSSPRAPSATASTFRAVADARAGRCRAALALAPVPTTTLDARMKRDRAPFDAAARRAMSRALSDDLTLAGGGGGGGGDGGIDEVPTPMFLDGPGGRGRDRVRGGAVRELIDELGARPVRVATTTATLPPLETILKTPRAVLEERPEIPEAAEEENVDAAATEARVRDGGALLAAMTLADGDARANEEHDFRGPGSVAGALDAATRAANDAIEREDAALLAATAEAEARAAAAAGAREAERNKAVTARIDAAPAAKDLTFFLRPDVQQQQQQQRQHRQQQTQPEKPRPRPPPPRPPPPQPPPPPPPRGPVVNPIYAPAPPPPGPTHPTHISVDEIDDDELLMLERIERDVIDSRRAAEVPSFPSPPRSAASPPPMPPPPPRPMPPPHWQRREDQHAEWQRHQHARWEEEDARGGGWEPRRGGGDDGPRMTPPSPLRTFRDEANRAPPPSSRRDHGQRFERRDYLEDADAFGYAMPPAVDYDLSPARRRRRLDSRGGGGGGGGDDDYFQDDRFDRAMRSSPPPPREDARAAADDEAPPFFDANDPQLAYGFGRHGVGVGGGDDVAAAPPAPPRSKTASLIANWRETMTTRAPPPPPPPPPPPRHRAPPRDADWGPSYSPPPRSEGRRPVRESQMRRSDVDVAPPSETFRRALSSYASARGGVGGGAYEPPPPVRYDPMPTRDPRDVSSWRGGYDATPPRSHRGGGGGGGYTPEPFGSGGGGGGGGGGFTSPPPPRDPTLAPPWGSAEKMRQLKRKRRLLHPRDENLWDGDGERKTFASPSPGPRERRRGGGAPGGGGGGGGRARAEERRREQANDFYVMTDKFKFRR